MSATPRTVNVDTTAADLERYRDLASRIGRVERIVAELPLEEMLTPTAIEEIEASSAHGWHMYMIGLLTGLFIYVALKKTLRLADV